MSTKVLKEPTDSTRSLDDVSGEYYRHRPEEESQTKGIRTLLSRVGTESRGTGDVDIYGTRSQDEGPR